MHACVCAPANADVDVRGRATHRQRNGAYLGLGARLGQDIEPRDVDDYRLPLQVVPRNVHLEVLDVPCVRVRARVCVRACVRVCVCGWVGWCACMRVWVCAHAHVRVWGASVVCMARP